ncbi:MAG: diacylglycerol kinase family protein [bacterium]
MSKYKAANIFISFRFAIRGLALALRSQKNFRTDLIIGFIVIISAVLLKFSHIEMIILILTIGFMLFAELINTVIEFVIDAYFGNKYSILAKMAKDISAGSVFIAALFSVMIGILLFLPNLLKFCFH